MYVEVKFQKIINTIEKAFDGIKIQLYCQNFNTQTFDKEGIKATSSSKILRKIQEKENMKKI